MEIKQFDEYTKEEIKNLLFFWFRYYGKKAFTFEEYDKFMQMVEKEPTVMFETAAILYHNGCGSTPLLDAMRGANQELTHYLKGATTLSNINKLYLKRDFIDEIVTSYNNPEPAISADDQKLDQQIRELTGIPYKNISRVDLSKIDEELKGQIRDIMDSIDKTSDKKTKDKLRNKLLNLLKNTGNMTIDPEVVKEIFVSCMFKDTDIKDERPTKPFSIVEGINNLYFLDTEKVNEYKMQIKSLIDALPDLSQPASFETLCTDKSHNIWTKDQQIIEILIVLGVAAEIIEYSMPRSEWEEKSFGLPLVVATGNKIAKKICGYEPCEFDEVVAGFEAEYQKIQENSHIDSEVLELFNKEYSQIEPIIKFSGYSIIYEDNIFYLCRSNGEKIGKMQLDAKLGGFSLTARDDEYSIQYSYQLEGELTNGKRDRNILSINGIKKLDDKTYEGRHTQVHLVNGVVAGSQIPCLEINIAEPGTDDVTMQYNIHEFDFDIRIESDSGIYGNTKEGTKRTLNYTDTEKKTCKCPLFILESDSLGNAFWISIEDNGDNQYSHVLSKLNEDRSREQITLNNQLSAEYLKKVTDEYLKTSRVKNLYHHIAEHIETILPGIGEYIKLHYPLANNIENIMKDPASKEVEKLLNDNAIEKANLPEEKKEVKKGLNPNQ